MKTATRSLTSTATLLLLALSLLSFPTSSPGAAPTNVPAGNLPQGTTLSGTDRIMYVQGNGAAKTIPWQSILWTNFPNLAARPVFNVKHPPFNARGDGTGDDGPAIQAAINATMGGLLGDVYIPSGEYQHFSTITNVYTGGDFTYREAGRGADLQVFGDGGNTKLISSGVTNGPGVSWSISKAQASLNKGFSSVFWSDMFIIAPTNGQPAMFIGIPEADSSGITSGQFGGLRQITFYYDTSKTRPDSVLVISNTVNFTIDQCTFPISHTRRANILAAHCDSIHIADTLMRAEGASNTFNVEIVDTGEASTHTGNGFVMESCQWAGPIVKGHTVRNLQVIGGHVESSVHPQGVFNFSNRCSVAIVGLDFGIVESVGTTISNRHPVFKLAAGAGRGVELFAPNLVMSADYPSGVSFPWFWITDNTYSTPHPAITPRWYGSDKTNQFDGIQNCIVVQGGVTNAYWHGPVGSITPAIAAPWYFSLNGTQPLFETHGTGTPNIYTAPSDASWMGAIVLDGTWQQYGIPVPTLPGTRKIITTFHVSSYQANAACYAYLNARSLGGSDNLTNFWITGLGPSGYQSFTITNTFPNDTAPRSFKFGIYGNASFGNTTNQIALIGATMHLE